MGTATDARLRLAVHGAVQGVGFRPFVYRLARATGLKGWVGNSPQGVVLEVEGPQERLDEFLLRLPRDVPPPASIHSLEPAVLEPAGYREFAIRPSDTAGAPTALVLPDIATCPACRAEIADPADRRYGYPFTNCTHCGPRYSIIDALPYDRASTSMAGFDMCAACRAEYEDPADRRFHAQPNACPDCGPQLALWNPAGGVLAERQTALEEAAAALGRGAIVAVKGLGGFHLMVDARDPEAVARLRRRKRREAKPLALMFPSLERLEGSCRVSPLESRLLQAPEAPIVLLERRPADGLAEGVAPGNPYLGAMLPYTPLHHLLLGRVAAPLVATSGNLSDEPICIDQDRALKHLGGVADLFLVHDRPIRRQVDDSVARLVAGRQTLLRRARGYAPLPLDLPRPVPPSLAVGGHLKNSVAVGSGRRAFVSQHIGDLETGPAYEAFRRVSHDLGALYACRPRALAADLHPDYRSTRHAAERARDDGLPLVQVQHHYAHILACMAENHAEAPVLGVAWDGSGYGTDGSVWGGEFLRIGPAGYQRVAHLRTFPLPGGEAAVRQPRRSALGLLYALWGEETFGRGDLAPLGAFAQAELPLLARALQRRLNTPLTSSVGRLFDGVASIAGLLQESRFEGEAAMALEFAVDSDEQGAYPIVLDDNGTLDWGRAW